MWLAAEPGRTAELTYVEAAAALARAQRTGRLTPAQHGETLHRWDDLWDQVVVLPVDTALVRSAASLAAIHGLRGHDAVHCAAAVRHADSEVGGPPVTATSSTPGRRRAWPSWTRPAERHPCVRVALSPGSTRDRQRLVIVPDRA
jgi:hypothetical protein